MSDKNSQSDRLQQALNRIRTAESQCGRKPNSVQLLAISKTKPVAQIIETFEAGQRLFGESYLQEAQKKIEDLSNYPIEWHFVGPIQSNKAKGIAALFSWVHSVDRILVAQKLSRHRPEYLSALNVCVQVNISREASKSGVDDNNLDEMIDTISSLPRLNLRGLMVIPAVSASASSDKLQQQMTVFARLRQRFEILSKQYELDTLSMGMSSDFESAIAEGATIVRLGTMIFGSRERRHS